MSVSVSDEKLREAVALREQYKSINAAAEAAGIPYPTLRGRLVIAARRGLMGTKPILPGFELSKTTTVTNADGETVREFIQQRPERGAPFEVPAGHTINNVSALTDGDGRTIQTWIKTRRDDGIDLTEVLQTAFAEYKGCAVLPPAPATTDADLLTIYNIADHHLGLYAWAQEAGADYDVEIGGKLLRDAMGELVASAPASETAIVLNLGDFFHADNQSNRTERSGVSLDVDTRYSKVLRIGVDLLRDCIEFALQRHERVIVRCLPGNHDGHTAQALSIALASFFHGHERVTIDCDPSRFFHYRFGSVLIGATHGDMVKAVDMPGYMAAHWPEDWGATRFRYAYLGHVHHKSVGGGERQGVVWETFQTLSAKDAWHAASGYSSGRSMTAITHHRDRGEYKRHIVQAPRPGE